jgi:hypothetical protein
MKKPSGEIKQKKRENDRRGKLTITTVGGSREESQELKSRSLIMVCLISKRVLERSSRIVGDGAEWARCQMEGDEGERGKMRYGGDCTGKAKERE